MMLNNIQSMTVMMAVMAYAAPRGDDIKECQLLNEIKKEIQIFRGNLSKNELEIYVKKISSDGGPKCVDKFFCSAEKVLNSVNIIDPAGRLLHTLHQYNELQNVTCHLNTTDEYRLAAFLNDTVECIDVSLNVNGCRHLIE